MSTAQPSKGSVLFNVLFLVLCVIAFIWEVLALFGVVSGDLHSLVVLIIPILLGAGFLSRLWLVWRGKQAPLSLVTVLSLTAGGLALFLWSLSGRSFTQYDLLYLLLLPLPFVMSGVLRCNKPQSQFGGDDSSPTA